MDFFKKLINYIQSLLLLPVNIQVVKKKIELLNVKIDEEIRLSDLRYHDLVVLMSKKTSLSHNSLIELKTNHPIAIDSKDHISPLGAAQDNTRNLKFVNKCETLFKKKLSFLDVGCSGGG